MSNSREKVLVSLAEIGIDYQIIEIDPAFSDTARFCEKYQYPPTQTCNTIIVAAKKGEPRFAACVILANTRLDVNKRVKALLGSKVSFATAEEMISLTGMEIGGVTPLALPSDLPLFIDDRIEKLDWIILGGGSREIKIKVSPEILTKLGGQFFSQLALINIEKAE